MLDDVSPIEQLVADFQESKKAMSSIEDDAAKKAERERRASELEKVRSQFNNLQTKALKEKILQQNQQIQELWDVVRKLQKNK